tara:strand:- start:787 stop:1284 length:498 start_codon:yes stop_codon:yes gene_type:complete
MTSTLKTDKIEGVTASGTVQMPEGSVIQMQNATLAGGANTTSSTSFVDTGLTVNITPKFATSKIFVTVYTGMQITASTNARIDFRLVSGSTELYRMDYYGMDSNTVGTHTKNMAGSGVFQCSDTSQLTFKTQVRKGGGYSNEAGTIYYDWYINSIHTIIAMEIAQ